MPESKFSLQTFPHQRHSIAQSIHVDALFTAGLASCNSKIADAASNGILAALDALDRQCESDHQSKGPTIKGTA